MTLEEIEKLCKEATPGPWLVSNPRSCQFYYDKDGKLDLDMAPNFDIEWHDDGLGAEIEGPEEPNRSTFTIPDAKFIASSRELMPKLLRLAFAAEKLTYLWDVFIEREPKNLQMFFGIMQEYVDEYGCVKLALEEIYKM